MNTMNENHYKVGDKIVNAAGVITVIKKECLNCKTLMGINARGNYKCCTRACPGWKQPKPSRFLYRRNQMLKSYVS
jgi:hypothetical protein